MSSSSEDRISKFVDSVSKLRGISYVSVSSEGLPFKAAGIQRQGAEYIAAISHSLFTELQQISKEVDLGTPAWMKVFLKDNTNRIYIFPYDKFILTVKYDYVLDKLIEKLIENLVKGIRIICQHCGADLTFEVYKCPKCGSSLTYNVKRCWNCGADVSIKQCPKCGKYILPDGSKPGFITLLILKIKSIFSK
ncbi:hypothetical protein EYM_00675 [Ignicoccus islandicus DSM 13165]|uniref:DZANK-type domain-containing protein n=1 Tax=Ignicoccus islandicus DSM 13165 TaxID=940295 RepID=A0A0U2U7P5_9CREN|nr:roadblock/LC7 domain-containing protein [Ignicoccus islandicus]ALU12132.1 hypothetical protein EYM_00675 [Ignicoccus islandicus DSM 13165]